MAGFQQPPAPNSPPKAPTPLELAIYEFEKRAKAYHQRLAESAPPDESPSQAKAREAACQRDLEHLECERTRIRALVQIQAQLEQYRADCKKKSFKELLAEPHHPTRKLAKHMTAAAEPKPSPHHDPHHIIPGKGRWLQSLIVEARLSMHICGIGINDPLNGVWLPRDRRYKGHWATPKAPAHKELHRYKYEEWIAQKFRKSLPVEAFKGELRLVKAMLKGGGYPPSIVQPKNA
ncbi:AHH domain-containing protein [Microbulbifer thermotolerans]|uniref:AHH domain-containing protein n=1 Tax=Microbulbifer thermotolerans TaxID=252514 RepID=UPI0026732E56|nr:AHH domain-containing protein [Microbulbifer thermotolerans]WKT59940.1 AHH domain-containing protein [Microbulbifer thermotolerans]